VSELIQFEKDFEFDIFEIESIVCNVTSN